jgi:hypothetical protein
MKINSVRNPPDAALVQINVTAEGGEASDHQRTKAGSACDAPPAWFAD